MTRSRRRARWFALFGAILLCVASLWVWTRFGADLWNDHIQYWSAAKVLLDGGNPYDPNALLDAQLAAGREREEAILMWNPPWVLTLFLPLALVPYRTSALIWLLLQTTIVLGGCGYLWRLYGGDPDRSLRGFLIGILFPPVFLAIGFGQVSLIVFLALVLFLWFVQAGRFTAAGASAFLMTIKPHLLVPFGVVLLAWALKRGRRRVLLGALGAAAILSVVPVLLRAGIYGDYLAALGSHPPREFVTDTLSAGLRLIVGWDRFWVQFIPVVVGVAWAVSRWVNRRHDWSWREELPLLALVSAVVAPYGWLFDFVTALPALLQVAAIVDGRAEIWVRRSLFAAYLCFVIALTTMHILLWDPIGYVHGWLAPVLLAGYVAARVRMERSASPAINRPGRSG
jgi:hypothetical protein